MGTELYTALRMLGVPVEQVVYLGEAHVFNRPAHQIDALTRVAACSIGISNPGRARPTEEETASQNR